MPTECKCPPIGEAARSAHPASSHSLLRIPRSGDPVRRGLTFWLLFPALSIVVLSSAGLLLGTVSISLHLGVCIPTYYFLAMCAHDAIHRAAHGKARLNALVGWISAAVFGLIYPVIRRAHLSHHASFGHEDDIEAFVYRTRWLLPARLLVVNWKCYAVLPQLSRIERQRAAVFIAGIVGLVILWPCQLFWTWLLPMQIGIAIFALLTVYLPHGPHSDWIMKHVPAVTGFHDDHHAMPHYPWYQYFSLRRARARRRLRFCSLDDVLREAERIASARHVDCHGNWTPAQVFEHLAKSFRSSVHESVSMPSLWQRTIARALKPVLLRFGLPSGIRIEDAGWTAAGEFLPGATPSIQQTLTLLREVIAELNTVTMTARHNLFGPMSHRNWEMMHCRHAELHMSFLHPVADSNHAAYLPNQESSTHSRSGNRRTGREDNHASEKRFDRTT